MEIKATRREQIMRILGQSGTEKGFTLVEVLVALAILAVGLLMAATLQTTAITGNKTSNEMNAGTLIAQQAIEQLLTYDASSNAALTYNGGNPHSWPTQKINGIVYTPTYLVVTDTPITGVRTIIMTVQWTDKTSHTVTMVERMTP